MSWGTPTVVTATSALLEFQTDEDSGLVSSEAVMIPAGEHRYPPGSAWAEPDVEQATALLRAVASEPGVIAVKVGRARQAASRRFSRSVAVAKVRARLADIDARLHAVRRSDRVSVERARDHAAGRR